MILFITDIKHIYPHFFSEMTQPCHTKCKAEAMALRQEKRWSIFSRLGISGGVQVSKGLSEGRRQVGVLSSPVASHCGLNSP